MRILSNGSIVIGSGTALNNNATDGFLYIPSGSGIPSGTPTTQTGSSLLKFQQK